MIDLSFKTGQNSLDFFTKNNCSIGLKFVNKILQQFQPELFFNAKPFKAYLRSRQFILESQFVDRAIYSFRTSKVNFFKAEGPSRFCTRKADLNNLGKPLPIPNDYTDEISAVNIQKIFQWPLASFNKPNYRSNTFYLSNITSLSPYFHARHCFNFSFQHRVDFGKHCEENHESICYASWLFFLTKNKE